MRLLGTVYYTGCCVTVQCITLELCVLQGNTVLNLGGVSLGAVFCLYNYTSLLVETVLHVEDVRVLKS